MKSGLIIENLEQKTIKLYELYIRGSYFISFNKYTNTQVIILLQLSH